MLLKVVERVPREFLKKYHVFTIINSKNSIHSPLMQLSSTQILVADRGAASDAYNTIEDNMTSTAEQ